MRCPGHRVIVVTDHVAGFTFTRIPGKGRVAAKVVELAVLPENAHGGRIDDRLQEVLRIFERRFGLLQGGFQFPVLGQFAHQMQGVVRQRAIDRQDEVDQRPRIASHQFLGPRLGSLERQTFLQCMHGVGHGPVGFENMRSQPARQEAEHFLGHGNQRAGAQFAPQPGDFLHEEGVCLAVLDFVPVVRHELPPDRLFRREVIDRVIRQLIEQAVEDQALGAECDMTGQLVDQANQIAMLLIDCRQAGVEIVVPGEDVY